MASGSLNPKPCLVRDTWVVPHLDRILDRARISTGKRFRSRMVELSGRLILAYRQRPLTADAASRLALAGQAIEDIHLGSLVIDDIQDGSLVRRGQPSLHHQVGVPLALNAGNWLYFSALKNLMKVPWSSVCECEAVDLAIESMLQAHEGQAIDLGVDITTVPDHLVASAVEASANRKTGALMAAAFGLGFLAAHPDGEFEAELYHGFQKFGRNWGVALQMFDDLGAFQQSLLGLEPTEKLFEDFRNRRPSFFWTLAMGQWKDAESVPRKTVSGFVKVISDLEFSDSEFEFGNVSALPQFQSFRRLIDDSNLIQQGAQLAMLKSESAIAELASDLASGMASENVELQNEFNFLRKISSDLAQAYGNFATMNTKNANKSETRIVEGAEA